MTIRTASILSILATGAGCAIGIPIGINTAPETCETLTWIQMVDKCEDSWKKIANQAYYTEEARALHEKEEIQRIKKVQEFDKRMELQEKQEEQRDAGIRKNAEWRGRMGLTVSGTIAQLDQKKKERQQRIEKRKEEVAKMMQKRTWEETRDKISKEFDKKNERA